MLVLRLINMNDMNTNINNELVILGKRIAYLRAKNGFTQEMLAEIVNYSTNHISKLELARTNPSFELLVKIANAFHIDLKELFNFDEYNDIDYMKEKLNETIKHADEKFIKILYKIQENLKS